MEDAKKTVDVAEALAEEEKQTDATEQKEDGEQKAPDIDYEKLASIVEGKQTATEDSVLKGYFKQQGLTPDEMKVAIDSFKKQKAENTPDVKGLEQKAQETLTRALKAETQNEALLMASELGVDAKAIPFLVRMADIDTIIQSGEVDKDALKNSLNEIISAMPQLKQKTVKGGFQTIGVDTTQSAQQTDEEDLKRAFGVKK